MSEAEFDYLIIGSGFGGSVSALRLVEKGYRVGVLEMGRRVRPEQLPRTSWDLARYLWAPALGLHGIQQFTLLRDVLVLHGAGVGGGSLVYGNVLYEPGDDWYRAPGWPSGIDWKARLRPHYETAKRMLGAVPTPQPAAADVALREVALSMGRGDSFELTPVGVHFGAGPGVVSPDPFFGGEGPPRVGCTRCGCCMIGCRYGGKNTLDKNYLYLAEKRGAEVMPDTRAVDVRRRDGTFEVTCESMASLGRPRRVIAARRVVLAAGVMGTVDLLLRCRERGSLALPDALGKRVRTNGEALVGARKFEHGNSNGHAADFTRGTAIQSGFWSDAHTHIESCRFPAGSDLLGLFSTFLVPGGGLVPRGLRWLGSVLRHPGRFLRFFEVAGWARQSIVLLVMQSVDNQLDLALRRRWYAPLHRALDTAGGRARPPSWIRSADEAARRLAEKIGGVPSNLLPGVLLDVSATAHILGGCVIGDGPDQGVVGEDLQVFGNPGLYIVDGSVIPANLGTNPSLTITALAEWAMSRIPPRAEAPSPS